jgi:hypothetical protein
MLVVHGQQSDGFPQANDRNAKAPKGARIAYCLERPVARTAHRESASGPLSLQIGEPSLQPPVGSFMRLCNSARVRTLHGGPSRRSKSGRDPHKVSFGRSQEPPFIETPTETLLSRSVNDIISVSPSFQLVRANIPRSLLIACPALK